MTKLLDRLSDEEVSRAGAGGEAGFGALSTERGRLPLAALDVRARIDGLLAQVRVSQTFVNSFNEPLEATYIFPLPDRAGVTHFRMEVGGRVVEGQLKERGAARREYTEAVQAGHRAAITEEERPGVFTLRVGNLMPGESATVCLTLAGPLPYAAGEATFRFPLVVAPRYIPGTALPGDPVGEGTAADTAAVPDSSRISPPVLLPGFPNPVRLSIAVDLAPSALGLCAVRSSLHAVEEQGAGSLRRIVLDPGARLDRDFILRLRYDDRSLRTSLVVQPDSGNVREGTFLLTVVPPLGQAPPKPRDVVFVLDRSGSMSGWKMVAARRAVGRMVDTLLDQDRFTVLAFDYCVESPPDFGGTHLVHASDRHRFRAIEFLAQVHSRGGTELAQPLQAAVIELARGGPGRDRVLVLITDGQVGNEDQILHTLGPNLRGLRVFCLGIDQAVNAAFLNRLAELGGGGCELVESEDRLDEVMDQMHRRIGQPVLTALKVEPAGLRFEPDSLVPGRLPDVFAGSPVLILGRYQGMIDGGLSLQATEATGQPWQATVRGEACDSPALASVWARGQVRKLEDRYLVDGDRAGLERKIVETSLRFGVLSRFTAYVAVDRSAVVNEGGEGRQIVQPVETPAGWAETESAISCLMMPLRACAPPAAPADAEVVESVDSMLAEFTDTAIDFTEGESDRRLSEESPDNSDFDLALEDIDEDLDDDAEEAPRPRGVPTERKPASARDEAAGSEPGWFRRLFGSLLGKKRESLSLDECRRQAAELLKLMTGVASDDTAVRRATLLELYDPLARLLAHVTGIADPVAGAGPLLQAFRDLDELRQKGGGDDGQVEKVWQALEGALRAFAKGDQGTPRRESFWK